jgi:integrase
MRKLLNALHEYLAMRRNLGFALVDNEESMLSFIRFMESQGADVITTELALRWATQPEHTSQIRHARRLGIVRDFARYMSATDPRTEVPPQGLLSVRYYRPQPYIYTENEVLTVIRQAALLQPCEGIQLRPFTYSTLFGVLAVTGMRVSEVVALDCCDVDLEQGVITIRQGKFGKTRILPVHSSVLDHLRAYRQRRDALVGAALTSSFFVSDRKMRLTDFTVRYNFHTVAKRIGLIRESTGTRRPRVHDLRHTFAVRTLTSWYRGGGNPERFLPLLSVYLGHVKVSNTYWYLSAVPELLGAVKSRLEKFLGEPS